MLVSRVGVCVWAVIMGAIMCIAQDAGINVNWLITIIGATRCIACGNLACTECEQCDDLQLPLITKDRLLKA